MNKIKSMLALQQSLNDNTNGLNWENGLTKNDKKIDWRRCIYLECAELIESYPWKHWKSINASADYENIKIEVVDIWHFILSEILRLNKKNLSFTDLAKEISHTENFSKFNSNIINKEEDNYKEIEVVEDFLTSLFAKENYLILVDKFFQIAIQSKLNLDSMYQLYIGKNILNKFRQDNGYKEGTYIKVWDKKEDNVVMQEILERNKEISPDGLYEELERVYDLII